MFHSKADLRWKKSPLLPWAWEKLAQQNWFHVNTAATDIDAHIPHTSDHPVVLVPHHHGLGVSHQHLGLHLLALIVIRTTTPFSRVVAQDLGYCFWNTYSFSVQFLPEFLSYPPDLSKTNSIFTAVCSWSFSTFHYGLLRLWRSVLLTKTSPRGLTGLT